MLRGILLIIRKLLRRIKINYRIFERLIDIVILDSILLIIFCVDIII